MHLRWKLLESTTWSPYGLSPPAPGPACPLVIRSSGAHTVWSTKTKKCLKQTKHNHAKWCETETKNIGDIGVDGSKSKTSTTLGLDLSSTQNSLKSAAVLPKTKVSACDNSIPGTWHHFLESRESCNNHSTIYTYQQARLVVKIQNREKKHFYDVSFTSRGKPCLHKTHPLALSVACYMNHTALTPDPTHPKSPWASQVVCKSWALVSPSPLHLQPLHYSLKHRSSSKKPLLFLNTWGGLEEQSSWCPAFIWCRNLIETLSNSQIQATLKRCLAQGIVVSTTCRLQRWTGGLPHLMIKNDSWFLTQELAQPEVICLLFKKSSNLLRVDLAESLQVTGCIDGALIHLLLSVVLS